MKNVRNTRHALLTSLMALLLCFTMLLGTTYAWFTDSVTSEGNKIQAGTLKIDLEMLTKKTDGTTEWNSIKEDKTPIFDYQLWEPGYTSVKVLKVENEGNLALKWKATLVAPAGLSELADVIDVYVLPSANEIGFPADRNLDGYTKVGTVAEFAATLSTTTVGTLTPMGTAGAVAYLGLALKMQEEAGNIYQGVDLGAFDIQILATQLNTEEDSFDENYDANLDPDASGIEQTLSDGSVAFYYDETSVNAGMVQLTKLPESFTPGDEYVIPEEVNTLSGVLANQHFAKLTIPAGVTYARKSLQGTTIDEVVIKDGATVIPDRMFYMTNVQSVVIPESVVEIETNAFSQAQVRTLVVPASVTTLGDACFAYMPNLESVVFEGDITLPAYAFRACPKLARVEFKGDVTIATTSMVFSNYESGGKDDMSFYVNSQENADKLIACLGTYNDTATGSNSNKWTVYVD